MEWKPKFVEMGITYADNTPLDCVKTPLDVKETSDVATSVALMSTLHSICQRTAFELQKCNTFSWRVKNKTKKIITNVVNNKGSSKVHPHLKQIFISAFKYYLKNFFYLF